MSEGADPRKAKCPRACGAVIARCRCVGCPHCDHLGPLVKGRLSRVSARVARICESCKGRVR